MYAMVSHSDDNYRVLADLTWHKNKLPYAERHGYVAFNQTENFVTRSSKYGMSGFEKIHLSKTVLDNCPEIEWLWWTGTDSIVTNYNIKIEDKVDNDYDFMICVDVNGINADSFLVKNSEQGRSFLQAVLDLEPQFNHYWDTEQRAIAYLLGFPGTGEPGWPFGDQLAVAEPYRNIVKILPQRHMNSFYYKIYHYVDQRDKLGVDGNWQSGDWLLHWPGTDLKNRLQLYQQFKNQIIL